MATGAMGVGGWASTIWRAGAGGRVRTRERRLVRGLGVKSCTLNRGTPRGQPLVTGRAGSTRTGGVAPGRAGRLVGRYVILERRGEATLIVHEVAPHVGQAATAPPYGTSLVHGVQRGFLVPGEVEIQVRWRLLVGHVLSWSSSGTLSPCGALVASAGLAAAGTLGFSALPSHFSVIVKQSVNIKQLSAMGPRRGYSRGRVIR